MRKKLLAVPILLLLLGAAFVAGQRQGAVRAQQGTDRYRFDRDQVGSSSLGLQRATETRGPLEGTWRLVSSRYGNATQFRPASLNPITIKHYTRRYYTWVTYEAKTGKVLRSSGGTYSFHGDSFQGNHDFSLGGDVQGFPGKPSKFTIQVSGDRQHLLGTIPTGVKIEEIWERVLP